MIIRLALSLILATVGSLGSLSGLSAPTGTTGDVEVPTVASVTDTTGELMEAFEDAAVRVEAEDAAASEPTDLPDVSTVDVVVPQVSGGEVVADDAVLAASPDDLVADTVDGGRVVTPVLETEGFQTLGVTWPAETAAASEGLAVEVRTRSVDGEWSGWTALDPADDGPDVGSPDAVRAVRGGTDSLWVGDAEAVQVSFDAQAQAGPDGLELTLVDVPEVAVEPDASVQGAASAQEASIVSAAFTTTAVQTASSAPTVISRAQWGARAQVCTPNVATSLVGAVVHHTAGSNSYSTVAQAMQQIRGDQAYHIDGRGWCDLGYNFVVDKWGNLYEGRANSLTKAVVGVHAGGFNTGTLGISMLGSYDAAPSAATQAAVAQIIGWRLGYYGVDPSGSMTYHTLGGENSKVPAGTTVVLPRVIGHRDVAYTACPGNGGYAALPGVRTQAASYSFDTRFLQAQAVVKAMYWDFLKRGSDASGMATWSALLVGGSGLPALVANLTDSDEYITLRITRAYRDVLARSPEPAGLEHWTREIRAGNATVDDVTRTFLSTPEFRDRFGGTDEGYLRAMYSAVLGRSATSSEVTYWVGQIQAVGRDAVTDQIWFSTEAAGNRASVYYRQFLNRSAEPAGRAFWADVLLTQGEGAVRIGIAGSEEYRALAVAAAS